MKNKLTPLDESQAEYVRHCFIKPLKAAVLMVQDEIPVAAYGSELDKSKLDGKLEALADLSVEIEKRMSRWEV